MVSTTSVFFSPIWESSHIEMLKVSNVSSTSQEFCSLLAFALKENTLSSNACSSLTAMPARPLTQWGAFVDLKYRVEPVHSDAQTTTTADYHFQHLFPYLNYLGVPRVGDILISSTAADITQERKERAVKHHSRMTRRSIKTTCTTTLAEVKQIAEGCANWTAVLDLGVKSRGDENPSGTTLSNMYRQLACT